MSKKEEVKTRLSLKREILAKMTTLATAAFGLVAALAWDEMIQSLFRQLFPDRESVVVKFYYAVIVTALVVLITLYLGRLSEKLKKQEDELTSK